MNRNALLVGIFVVTIVMLCFVVVNQRRIAFYVSAKGKEVSVSFYGQLLDQYGQPVAGALVEMLLFEASFLGTFTADAYARKIVVTTDKEGLFDIENMRGWELIVRPIAKEGYQFTRFEQREHKSGYEYDKKRTDQHVPNKSKPVTYHLHKVGETSFLLMGEDRLSVHTDGKLVIGEIARDRLYFNPNYYTDRREKNEKFPGFSASASIDQRTQDWVLTFKGKHEGDTVLLSDHVVYSAPETGYQQSTEVKFPLHPDTVPTRPPTYDTRMEAWLIVKSARPVTYTRVEMEICVYDASRCVVKYQMTVNPYGDRTFEFDERTHDTAGHIRSILWEQAITALCNGELPRKPDIGILLEQVAREQAGGGK